MIEYLPWSNHVFESCLNQYMLSEFGILDIELGGQCNYNCIYCDSPMRNRHCSIAMDRIELAFSENNIKWVFICGLGEPTFGENFNFLIFILGLCEKYNAKCSIFTNLSNLNSHICKYIQKGILNILFKYDSNNLMKNMGLYGVPNVQRQMLNVNKLQEFINNTNNCTNIAASIVPTSINKDDILDVVRDCLNCGIYPLIAELEYSGDAQDYYGQLALKHEELTKIKNQIDDLIGDDYSIPVCPSVICGIHIRYDGKVTVDEYTGLSCHWFWLKEPKTKVIADFNVESMADIIKKIKEYRMERLKDVSKISLVDHSTVFGGCGGNIEYLLRCYLKISKEGENNDLS